MDKERVKDRVADTIFAAEGRDVGTIVFQVMAEIDRIWREDVPAGAAVLCAEPGCGQQAVKYRHRGNPERLAWCGVHLHGERPAE